MGRARRRQRDLFERSLAGTWLRPELRTKLAQLLQTLLTEAARAMPNANNVSDRGGVEGGDDEDHP